MLSYHAVPFLVVCIGVLGACSPDASERAGEIVTDSNGVRIVEAVPGERTFAELDRLQVEIGGADVPAEYAFGIIGGGLVLPGGGFAVADGPGAIIRTYDETGSHLEDWGRPGDGPGEFQVIMTIARAPGDSILVGEMGSFRVSILGPDGGFGRLVRPRFTPRHGSDLVPESNCCWLTGAMSDGSLVLTAPELIPTRGAGTRRARVDVARVPPGSEQGELLGSLPSGAYRPGAGGSVRSSGFHYNTQVSVSPHGEGYVAADGSAYEVRFFDGRGRLRTVSRVERPRAPMTERVRMETHQYYQEIASRPGVDPVGSGLQSVMDMPYPDSLPAYNTVLTDRAGRVWAGYVTTRRRERESFFDVFDGSGSFLGSVALPPRMRVLDVTRDRLLAVRRDDLDVPHIQLFALPEH